MGLLLRLLILHWVLAQGCCQDQPAWFQNITTSLFNSSGDYIFGGLFPINTLTSNLSQTEQPSELQCNSINQYGLGLSLVMKYAVDEINATPDLLPKITLGFETFDTCQQSFIIVKPTMYFLSQGSTQKIGVMCNYTNYNTRALAIIGPSSSDMVVIIGKLLGFFTMPLISYGATSDTFSDKQEYSSFMRTVPNDQRQAMAILSLLKQFGWNWVALVSSEDEYGKNGQLQMSTLAPNYSVCLAYEALIPMYSDPVPAVSDMLTSIQQASVGVVVVFATDSLVRIFFSEVIKQNMTGVWVATSSWALQSVVYSLPGISSIGTVLGFTYSTQSLTLLTSYAQELFTRFGNDRGRGYHFQFNQSNTSPLGNQCPECWSLSLNNLSTVLQPSVQHAAFSVYLAVYSAAHALHRLLHCNATSCTKTNVYPWQLLQVLKNDSFTINGYPFQFDNNGNPNIGYDVLTWVWGFNGVSFRYIGSYNNTLVINPALIKWYTNSTEVPKSTCAATCASGQVRMVKGFQSCCYDCIDCQGGTFQNQTEDIQCTPCPKGQWSSVRSRNCTFPVFSYLSWSSYEAMGLALAAGLLLACHGVVGLVFLCHRGTPIVDAAGGYLSAVCILSLMAGCGSVAFFLGTPNDLVCHLQQPLIAIFPTVTMSIILAMSLQIVCVMEFPEKAPTYLDTVRGPGSYFVVIACCGVQAGLCGWFIQEGMSLSEYLATTKVTFLTKFIRCPVSSMLGLGLMLGFNCVLSLVSFMCTFMAQKPSRQYNMARDITFAALFYCVVWVVFVPFYTGLNEKNKSIAQTATTLLSNIGVTAAYFMPKCYLLLTNPDLNTTDYFCSYLEGIPPNPEKDDEQKEQSE